MIQYKFGNLFDDDADAIVNAVNTDGIMGKGIALEFKKRFPINYEIYVAACVDKDISIGNLLVTQEENKIIINFPTKKSWRNRSEYSYIQEGLVDLARLIEAYSIKSVALPALGTGNGFLQWSKVKPLMEKHLKDLDCDIRIYLPR